MTSLEKALRDFALFAAKLRGDEKSEAQTFLFHLLAAFGHDSNTLPEGSTFEYRVNVPSERTRFSAKPPHFCFVAHLRPQFQRRQHRRHVEHAPCVRQREVFLHELAIPISLITGGQVVTYELGIET